MTSWTPLNAKSSALQSEERMAEAEKSHRIVSGKERRERIATAVLAVLGGIEDLTGEEKIRHAVDLADGLILELDKA